MDGNFLRCRSSCSNEAVVTDDRILSSSINWMLIVDSESVKM
jgi:hypothetical protein